MVSQIAYRGLVSQGAFHLHVTWSGRLFQINARGAGTRPRDKLNETLLRPLVVRGVCFGVKFRGSVSGLQFGVTSNQVLSQ